MILKKVLPLLILFMVLVSGCVDFSTLATSQPMQVQSIDYVSSTSSQVGGKYWKIATAIDGNGESYYLELPESQLQDGDVQAQKYLKLYFKPSNPYWHADCYDEDYLTYAYKYDYFSGITMTYKGYDDVPYTRISGTGQTIHTGYTATLEDENGNTIAQGTYNIDDLNQGTLQMQARDSDGFTRTIYITMDGMLPSGVLTPTGELATLWDGVNSRYDSSYLLVNYLTLQNKLTTYNSKTVTYLGEDWPDCFNWLVNNGVTDLKSSSYIINYDIEGVGYTTGSHPTGVKLFYDTSVFKPLVTVYIPEQLAETIIEEKAAPEPAIETISNIEAIEGGSVSWKVTVNNYGTAGDIQVSALSTLNGLQNIRTSGASQVYVGADKSYTWTFYADVADELTDSERDLLVTVTANGGVSGQFGTTDTETFTVTVNNKDVVQEDRATITITAVYEDSGEIYNNAPLFVGYGSDSRVGSGQVTYDAVQGIEYNIYSADSEDGIYLAQYTSEEPKKITPYGDVDVTIEFGSERPEATDFDITDVLVVVLIFLIGILIYMSGIWKYFIQNPMLLAVIALIIVIVWAVGEITGALESASSVIDSFKFWE